jgi:hypothetical protein
LRGLQPHLPAPPDFQGALMKSKSETPLSRQIASDRSIWIVSLASGFAVFAFAVFLQWLIYDDWMHRSGSLRLAGSTLALLLTCAFAHRWQCAVRRQKTEILERFEKIRWMNDRIRNSLQAIECLLYAANPQVTGPARDAVDQIEAVLQEVFVESHSTLNALVRDTPPPPVEPPGPRSRVAQA